jgi:hypothetical protein
MTSIAPPICSVCTHLTTDLREAKCTAFPGGIPTEILLSKADHRKPFPGDGGVTFEPKNAEATEYANLILGPAPE